jgi:hypothetical protein
VIAAGIEELDQAQPLRKVNQPVLRKPKRCKVGEARLSGKVSQAIFFQPSLLQMDEFGEIRQYGDLMDQTRPQLPIGFLREGRWGAPSAFGCPGIVIEITNG